MARPRRPYVAIRQREGRSGIGEEVPLLYLSILVGRGGTMPLKRGMDTGSRGRMRWSSGGNTGLRCKRGVDNYFVYTMIFNIGPLAGIFIANSDFSKQNSLAWNLGKECEVYDAEIFAIYKALEIGNDRVDIETLDIWVFSDSQAALKGLARGQSRANRALYGKIYDIAKNIREKGINIHVEWVPGHEGIYGNEKADQAAKYGAEWVE